MNFFDRFIKLIMLRLNTNRDFTPSYLWLLQYTKSYRHNVIFIVICGLVITLGEMAVPKFLQIIVDDLLPTKNQNAIYYMVGIIVLIYGLTFFAQRIRTSRQIYFSESVFRDIQINVLKHIRKLGIAFFEKNAVGHTLSIMNVDLQRIQGLLRITLPALLQDSMLIVLCLIFMATISVKLILCAVPAFIIYCLVGPVLSKKMLYYNGRLHAQRAIRDQKAYESVSAIVELRANNSHEWDAKRYDKIIDEMHRRWTIQQLWVRIRSMSSEFFYYMGTIVVIVVGTTMIRSDTLEIGAFVAFLFYFLYFIQTVARMFFNWADVELSIQQVRRVHQLMKEIPLIQEPKQPVDIPDRADFYLEHVHFAYDNGVPILRDVSLHIPYGSKVALVGPTGNGKTTLLKMLARFYDPSAGGVRLGDVSFRDVALDQLNQEIGYVFQESFMLGRTVRENIILGYESASEEEMIESAKLAYIHDEIMKMSEGYDTLVGERGVKLSGGQKQRIALARLFLKNPRIILLDEAMSALDSIHETKVQTSMEQRFASHTVISVVHRISAIQQEYDMLVVIDKGRIVEKGKYEELMANKGLFYQLITGEQAEQAEEAEEAENAASVLVGKVVGR